MNNGILFKFYKYDIAKEYTTHYIWDSGETLIGTALVKFLAFMNDQNNAASNRTRFQFYGQAEPYHGPLNGIPRYWQD